MTNEPALDWQLKNLGRYLMTLPTPKTSKDALEGVHSMIKTVSIPRGAYNAAVGIEAGDNRPHRLAHRMDDTGRFGEPALLRPAGQVAQPVLAGFSKLDCSKGAPVKSAPGNDISMNGAVSARLTGMK